MSTLIDAAGTKCDVLRQRQESCTNPATVRVEILGGRKRQAWAVTGGCQECTDLAIRMFPRTYRIAK